MARLARLIGVFDGGAAVHVLAAASTRDRGPEIIKHVAVEAEALARSQADHPHADAVAFRDQHIAHARIRVIGFAFELRRDLGRPCALVRTHGRLVHHRKCHGIPPANTGRVYSDLPRFENRTGPLNSRSAKRALVIGGSMSGLLTGLLLRRAGWDVDIFERVEGELAGRGAGIVAQPELIETLRALGLDATDLGVQISTRKILDASGRLTAELECPQVLTAWERVYRCLRDAFPPERYHRGRGLVRFEQTSRGVTADLSDGRSAAGDLLVGADGIRSTV